MAWRGVAWIMAWFGVYSCGLHGSSYRIVSYLGIIDSLVHTTNLLGCSPSPFLLQLLLLLVYLKLWMGVSGRCGYYSILLCLEWEGVMEGREFFFLCSFHFETLRHLEPLLIVFGC